MNLTFRHVAAVSLLAALLSSCAPQMQTVRAGTPCVADGFSVIDGFAGARRGSCTVLSDTHVRLAILPEDSGYINDSPWFSFKLQPKGATTATITLKYSGGHHRYIPKFSTDGLRWSPVPAESVQVSDDGTVATFDVALSGDPTWVSAQELVLPAVYRKWAKEQAATSIPELGVLGRSLRRQPIPMLQINQASKDVLLLVGRQHPPEVSGAVAFFSFYEALLADTALAGQFRERFHIVAIPMLNPDGILGGNWRHNLGGTDLNRDWGPFKQPETRLVSDLLDKLDSEDKKIRVFLDFHSTKRNLLYTQDEANETDPPRFTKVWLDRVATRGTGYEFTNEEHDTEKPGVSKNYIYRRYGIPASTFEVGDETDRELTISAAAVFAEELMRLMLEQDY